jgi:hypothetical protein
MMSASRGIYLVANKPSEALALNLVRSIRQSGCPLPVALIPFDERPVTDPELLAEAEVFGMDRFPAPAHELVAEMGGVLTQCPPGFLRRFLAFFGPFEEFLYSDNDIVALSDWTAMFDHLEGADLCHADGEGWTGGKYSFRRPEEVTRWFGDGAMRKAVNGGHFVIKRSPRMVGDIRSAMAWMKGHPGVAIEHDQALIHLALMIGAWKVVNLCAPPHHHADPWAGGYDSVLRLIQRSQECGRITHIHFSGMAPRFSHQLGDLLTAGMTQTERNRRKWTELSLELSGCRMVGNKFRGLRRRFRNLFPRG